MKPTVLFMCVHNAGRSQMAAGWLRHLAGSEIEVLSGGSEPGTALNPMAVVAMNEVGIDISANVPTIWTTQIVQQADVVVRMCTAVEVEQAEARLSATGLATTGIDDTICCYAEKVETWLTAPDGLKWEWYVKTADSDQMKMEIKGLLAN
jgi:protein-tyrosine-phosphatase